MKVFLILNATLMIVAMCKLNTKYKETESIKAFLWIWFTFGVVLTAVNWDKINWLW